MKTVSTSTALHLLSSVFFINLSNLYLLNFSISPFQLYRLKTLSCLVLHVSFQLSFFRFNIRFLLLSSILQSNINLNRFGLFCFTTRFLSPHLLDSAVNCVLHFRCPSFLPRDFQHFSSSCLLFSLFFTNPSFYFLPIQFSSFQLFGGFQPFSSSFLLSGFLLFLVLSL